MITAKIRIRAGVVGRAAAFCAFGLVALAVVPGVARADSGALDPSFGRGGKVVTSTGTEGVTAAAIDRRGRIVAATGNGSFSILRYKPNGDLDHSFGHDGVARANFPDSDTATISAIALDSRGRIVAAGSTAHSRVESFALARFDSAGHLDRSFGDDGTVTTGFGDARSREAADSVAIDSRGRIVAAGRRSRQGFALARYRRQGTLDPSFSDDGKVITRVVGSAGFPASAVIDSRDRIAVAGSAFVSGDHRFVVLRYRPNGGLDPTFAGDGKTTTDFGARAGAYAVTIDPQDRVVAAGARYTSPSDDVDIALARYRPDGRPDESFGEAGKVTTDFGTGALAWGFSVAIDTKGRTVVAGATRNPARSKGDFALARYGPDGGLDEAFGTGGKVTTDFGGDEAAFAVAIDNRDRIVAAGLYDRRRAALARYLG